MRLATLTMTAVLLAACGEGRADDWRRLNPVEVAQIAKTTAKNVHGAKADLAVSDDFDGDGQRDEAVVLVKGDEAALFVFRGAGGSPLRLSGPRPRAGLWNVDLSVLPPGRHATACGKGAGDREPCRPTVEIRFPGIELVNMEASSQVYFWNGQAFQSEWLSD